MIREALLFKDLSAPPLDGGSVMSAIPDQAMLAGPAIAPQAESLMRRMYVRARGLGVAVLAAACVCLPSPSQTEQMPPELPAASASFSPSQTQIEDYTPPKLPEFSASAAFLPTKGKQCPRVRPESVILADQLLAEDESPTFLKLPSDDQTSESMRSMQSWQNYLKRRHAQKHELANKLGLHVFDLPQSYDVLRQDLNSGQPTPFGAYLSVTQAFVRNYGVNIEIQDSNKTSWHNTRGPKPEELETKAAKEAMVSVMDYFEGLPRELIKLYGLKKIVLLATVDNPNPEVMTAAAMALPDTMFINISGSGSARTYAHESGHIFNFHYCPLGGDDPSFTNLNNDHGYDAAARPKAVTLGFAETAIRSLKTQAQRARTSGNVALARELESQAAIIRADITFISTAGNPGEDIADTGARISLLDFSDVLNPQSPRLEAKFLLLFARLAQENPRIAAYMAGMGLRPDRTAGTNPLVQHAAKLVAAKS